MINLFSVNTPNEPNMWRQSQDIFHLDVPLMQHLVLPPHEPPAIVVLQIRPSQSELPQVAQLGDSYKVGYTGLLSKRLHPPPHYGSFFNSNNSFSS